MCCTCVAAGEATNQCSRCRPAHTRWAAQPALRRAHTLGGVLDTHRVQRWPQKSPFQSALVSP